MDLRASLTRPEFEAAVSVLNARGFPVGEALFHRHASGREIHWGGPEFLMLNDTQKTLVLWRLIARWGVSGDSKIFDLFYCSILEKQEEALAYLDALDWPELRRRMNESYRQFRMWKKEVDAYNEGLRSKIEKLLTKKAGRPFRVDLDDMPMYAVILSSKGVLKLSNPDCPYVETFCEWMLSGKTKAEAVHRLRDWMRANQPQLCHIVEG